MKAFLLKKYAKKTKLTLAEVGTSIVKDNEVLVEVHASCLSLLDSKINPVSLN